MRKPILVLGLADARAGPGDPRAEHARAAPRQPGQGLWRLPQRRALDPGQKPSKFRHESTGFRLEGAHAQASCRAATRSLVFDHVGTACADCHKDAHRGELGSQCEACHVPASWTNQTQMQQVHNRTRLPLFATHARLDCAACHRSQRPYQYATTPAECGNCHISTYLATTNPSHAAAGFSRRCEDCHSVTAPSWSSSAFSHPATFPLAGGHAGLACSRCHGAGKPHAVGAACASCHETAFMAAANPSHARLPAHLRGLPHERVVAAGEVRPRQDPLPPDGGAHADRVRGAATWAGATRARANDCNSCHQPDYARTTNPNHRRDASRRKCQDCHNTGAWKPANFDHSKTRFALTGAHERTECARCHVGGRYSRHPDGLQLLPPARLRAHHEPEPPGGRLPDHAARPATARTRGARRASTTTAPASR